MTLLVLRPLSVLVATTGERLSLAQHAMVGWFGIRGIGSLYYLAYSINAGFVGPGAETVAGIVLVAIVASIAVHGVSEIRELLDTLRQGREKR